MDQKAVVQYAQFPQHTYGANIDVIREAVNSVEEVFQRAVVMQEGIPAALRKTFRVTGPEYQEWKQSTSPANRFFPPKKFDRIYEVENKLIAASRNCIMQELEPLLTAGEENLFEGEVTEVKQYDLRDGTIIHPMLFRGLPSRGSRVHNFQIQTKMKVHSEDVPLLEEIVYNGAVGLAEAGTEIRAYLPPVITAKDVVNHIRISNLFNITKLDGAYLNIKPSGSAIANMVEVLRDGEVVKTYVSDVPRMLTILTKESEE